MTENLGKCGVLQIIFCQALISVLPSSHFCPAKLPFLSCQAPISVLPRSHLFVLPSEAIFSRGGQGPPSPPSQLRLWVPMGAYQCLPVPHLCLKHLQVLSYSSLKGSFKVFWSSIPIFKPGDDACRCCLRILRILMYIDVNIVELWPSETK